MDNNTVIGERTDQTTKLVYLHNLCCECESKDCQYNHDGECRFALVHERKPNITDENGCADYIWTGPRA